MTTGCDTAKLLAPPPPLRAASAAHYAVDVEFAEPLERSSAEDVSRYTLAPVAGGAPAVIASATLIDTLNGRVVQLVVPDWLTTDPDTSDWRVSSNGVLDVDGHSTGARSVSFRTGLGYRAGMGTFFDAKCSACHGAAQAAGGYRTDSYAALFGPGTSATPNLIAGNPACLLVVKCRPHNSMFTRAGLSYFDYELVLNWTVGFGARL